MQKSETIQNLSAALAKFQGKIGAVKMNSINPFLKNKYADLGAIIAQAQPVMLECGLAVSQMVYSDDDRIGVETVLMHASGEWLSNRISMPIGDEKGKSLAQVAGSVITYMRRYALAAALGMYADEDGDGNAPKQSAPAKPAHTTVEQPAQVDGTEYFKACEVLSSKGVKYGDHDSEKLQYIVNNEKTPDDKRQAALIILRYRANSDKRDTPGNGHAYDKGN